VARPADTRVEIGHVLVLDVVGYSTLLITEQTRVIDLLTDIVRNTPRFREADAQRKLIRIATGDGMALLFFGDPCAPVDI